jgi:hypothetical protein
MSGDIEVVMARSAVIENVVVGVGILSVCRWKLKLHRPAEKLRFFSRRVPLVFQVAPGTGKNYVQAENAKTSGIGPSRKRF